MPRFILTLKDMSDSRETNSFIEIQGHEMLCLDSADALYVLILVDSLVVIS